MPENANLHWTEDDDLLAKYVLGRLTVEERKIFEAHLRSCLHCREAVRQEQEIVSGIRQYARDEAKSRLKRRLVVQSDSYRTLITWQRVMSAAAVMLVVVGLGIYNRWFSWGERKSPSITEEMLEPQRLQIESEQKTGQSKEKETKTARQQAPLHTSRDREDLAKPRTEQAQGDQSRLAVTKTQAEQNEGMNKLEKAAGAPSSGGAAISMNKDLGNAQDHIRMAQPEVTEFWVEGMVLQEQSQPLRTQLSLDKGYASEQKVPRPKKSAEQNEIRISQRNIQLLPIARRKPQQELGHAIQTSVQQSERGTSMTMYLDTLFNEHNLRNARVEEILPDSLVIEVESRKIGFKMPVNLFDLRKVGQRPKEK